MIGLIAKIILISQNYLFDAIQNGGKSNTMLQRQVIKFLLAEKCKFCEIFRRICDIYGKYILVKKYLQTGYIWVCYYEPNSKNQSMEWKHFDYLVKKKFRVQ